jgi:hypothetical protein
LLVLPAAFVNEKVPAIFCCVLLARGATAAPRFATGRVQLFSAFASVACYLGVRVIAKTTGHEEQLAPSMYWHNAMVTLRDNATAKAVELTWIPCLLLVGSFVLARRSYRPKWVHLRPADIVVLPFLFVLAFCTDVHLGVGRVVMHAFPFFLPLLSRWLDDASDARA